MCLESPIRLIAFYLPQFHPIPENDAWWGKGFTEWTNVAKAKPLYPGHYQPRIPADLGFYDLRVPEARCAQAQMARDHGVEGFAYWHYWFAGKRLLERPFNEVLNTGEPDYPFCLAWANDSWTGIWHGAPDRLLIEQTYPGIEDHTAHFYEVLSAFQDDRYMTVDGKPIFIVMRPYALPAPRQFTDCWRELAQKEGIRDLFFIGITWIGWDSESSGFDAYIEHIPMAIIDRLNKPRSLDFNLETLGTIFSNALQRITNSPRIVSYQTFARQVKLNAELEVNALPCILPGWDNTPRSGRRGLVLHGATPELFGNMLRQAVDQVESREYTERIIFIKSWNEWAEGNHLEPDHVYGKEYLRIVKRITEVRKSLQ